MKSCSRSPQSGWHPTVLVMLASAWMTVFANWPLWQTLWRIRETASLRGVLFMLAFAGIVCALTVVVLALFAWRHTVKPVITLSLVVAAVAAYFMGAYGVVVDPSMMVNVIQTDAREVRDLLNLQLLATLAVLGVAPAVWLWRAQLRPVKPLRANALAILGGVAVAVVLVVATYADFVSTMRNHRSFRYLINPLSTFYSFAKVAIPDSAEPEAPPVPVGLDAHVLASTATSRPPLVLLVIGEAARAANFSLNGYARATNPELTRLGVANFVATACGTSTAASLPCMFSHLGREEFEAREKDYENVLDVLQRAGLAVLWVNNQSGCKGVCARVPTQNTYDIPPDVPHPDALCYEGECHDEALLHGLDVRLSGLSAEQRSKGIVIVLHQMGSHGPLYWRRTPKDRKPFMPECAVSAIQECNAAELVNAYDNTIAYTDFVLARAVDWLRARQAQFDPALLYVSDHGESLGENGIYLHGLPNALAPATQTQVPWIVWMSPNAEARTGATLACLREQRDMPVSHDNLFHTVLGMAGVRATEYRADLDLLAPCRGTGVSG